MVSAHMLVQTVASVCTVARVWHMLGPMSAPRCSEIGEIEASPLGSTQRSWGVGCVV